ncbi:allantoinase isoform X2 [Cryptomeria japonica]|uniref:allantoinase isoform X2 n=1 Tax=Cryptomeria japonica TaxID=3369 RepID=UPI0025ABBF2A|nr:allantoinase isoform X2 [Cryptomeria japonica]
MNYSFLLGVAIAIAIGCLSILLPYFSHRNQGLHDGCSLLPHKHFWVYSNRVLTPGGITAAAVEISEGHIVSVVNQNKAPKKTKGVHVIDYGNAVIMPGLVDVHVHLNEPGRVEWEGFVTGTKAAAAGGFTTLIDMPLNSVPTTTSKEAFDMKVDAAKGRLFVDVGFWGGLVPENAFNNTAIDELLQAGALGLKSFMCPSGINDFGQTNASHIKEALKILAKYQRPLLVHAETPQPSEEKIETDDSERRMYSTYLRTRPPSWEEEAVKELIGVSKDTLFDGPKDGAHIHIVHLSDSSASLDLIKEAKESGARISVETCPHYLVFSAEEISDGDTRFKCAPPIRDALNRERLWEALKDGHIDMLSSDHSPSSPELKLLETGDFLRAWGGISSLQGTIVTGNDADLVVWDPEINFEIGENYTIYHKHPITPYAGKHLFGSVIATFVRANMVYGNGSHASTACGVPILAA